MNSQPLQFAFALFGIGVVSAIWSNSQLIPAGAFVGCGLAAIGHGLHTLAVATKENRSSGDIQP